MRYVNEKLGIKNQLVIGKMALWILGKKRSESN